MISFFGNSKEKEKKRLEEYARILYQIKEYDGKLWIMCNGYPAVPEDHLKDGRENIVNVLLNIRDRYVQRKTGSNEKGSTIEG